MTERQWTVLSETATKIHLGNGRLPGEPSIDVQDVVASETRLTKVKLFIEMIMESGTRRFSPASRNAIYNNRTVVFGYSFSRASTVMRPR